MNRIGNLVARATFWAASVVGGAASVAAQTFMLTPPYLAHLLWLIEQSFRELAKKGYGGNAAVYACIRLLCNAVPEPPLVAYMRQPDGQPGEPLPYQHPLAALLRRPNPLMTQFEKWELITIHTAIVGRSHWYKERNNLGQPIALWPLRPDRVGPVYAAPSDPEPVIIGWSYLTPGTAEYAFIPHRDVMTYNFPDPMGESGGIVEGLGPLQVLRSEVGADNEATNFVGAMISNYAQPGTIISTTNPVPDRDTATLIKAGYMRDFGGMRRGEPAVISKAESITLTGFNMQELEFPELRKISESRIAAAFGVPAVLVGLLVGLQAAIKATTDELRALFAETTLATIWRRFEEQYTDDVAVEFGEQFICKFDLTRVRALQSWFDKDFERIHEAWISGAITKNEYRTMIGYPQRADGDVYAYGIAQGRGTPVDVTAGSVDPTLDTSGSTDPDEPPPTEANPDQAKAKATTTAPSAGGRTASNGHAHARLATARAKGRQPSRGGKTTAAEDLADGYATLAQGMDARFSGTVEHDAELEA